MSVLVWRSARDGIGHCARAGHGRTLCGRVAVAEEFAWPVRLYCRECIELADGGRTLGLVPGDPEPARRRHRRGDAA